MALYFTLDDMSVLNFGPRHHTPWSSREFLLYPAWAYRVVAPRVRQRKFNILQRAVMGLCRTGQLRVADIANHLSVHKDLAAFIVTELRDLCYLDTEGLPTESGVKALEADAHEFQEMVAGYVFQDPWNGDLWPRFVETLGYCELEFGENRFPSLIMGTTGKPKRHSAFSVIPSSGSLPTPPAPSAIVEAVARHRRALRFRDVDDNDDESLGSFVSSGVQISRVSFVEKEPQAVFLMSYLYIPESDMGAMDWYACDPFGLGRSSRLRRRVESLMNDVPGLSDVIDRLVGETLHNGYQDQQRWLEGLKIRAGLEIEHRLTVEARALPAFDQLLAMESARQEMREYAPDCPERKINEVLRAGVKVLEAVFSSLTIQHPFGEIWKRVYVSKFDSRTRNQFFVQQKDRDVCSATFEGAFCSLGFDTPIPDSFVKLKPGHIRSVAEYHNHWRLRPLVTATALLAQQDSTHPFAQAAIKAPRLLVTINEIAEAGGGAGHAGSRSVSVHETEHHVDRVYDVVSVLTGFSGADLNSLNESFGDSHGEKEKEKEKDKEEQF